MFNENSEIGKSKIELKRRISNNSTTSLKVVQKLTTNLQKNGKKTRVFFKFLTFFKELFSYGRQLNNLTLTTSSGVKVELPTIFITTNNSNKVNEQHQFKSKEELINDDTLLKYAPNTLTEMVNICCKYALKNSLINISSKQFLYVFKRFISLNMFFNLTVLMSFMTSMTYLPIKFKTLKVLKKKKKINFI